MRKKYQSSLSHCNRWCNRHLKTRIVLISAVQLAERDLYLLGPDHLKVFMTGMFHVFTNLAACSLMFGFGVWFLLCLFGFCFGCLCAIVWFKFCEVPLYIFFTDAAIGKLPLVGFPCHVRFGGSCIPGCATHISIANFGWRAFSCCYSLNHDIKLRVDNLRTQKMTSDPRTWLFMQFHD